MRDIVGWVGIVLGVGTFGIVLFPRASTPLEFPLLPEAVAMTPTRGDLDDLRLRYAWANRIEDELRVVEELLRMQPERRDMRERALDLLAYAGRAAEGGSHAWWLVKAGIRSVRLRDVFLAARDTAGLMAVLDDPLEQARALTAIGAQKEAMDRYGVHLEQHPHDTEAHRELARLLLWNHQPLEAARHLEFVPTEEAHTQLCEIYRSLNRTDLLVAHEPNAADLLVSLGRIEEAKAEYLRRNDVVQLLRLAEGTQSDLEVLALRERLEPTRENLLKLAARYRWRKEFEEAIALYVAARSEEAIDLLASRDLPRAYRLAAEWGLAERRKELETYYDEIASSIRALKSAGEGGERLAALYQRIGFQTGPLGDVVLASPDTAWEEWGVAEREKEVLPLERGEMLPDVEPIEALIAISDPAMALQLETFLARWIENTEPRWREVLRAARRFSLADRERESEDELLRLSPEDVELLAEVGLRRSDASLLRRADALGSTNGRVLRRLAEISWAERDTAACLEYYRRFHRAHPGDAASFLAQAYLSREREDCLRALRELPASEAQSRGDLQSLLGEWAAAAESYGRAGDTAGVFQASLAARNWDVAEKMATSDRQRGIVAFHRGDLNGAANSFLKAETLDGSEQRMLAESLFLLGRWQEAERVADLDLRRDIEGAYGMEGSVSGGYRSFSNESATTSAVRSRAFLSETWDLTWGADAEWWRSSHDRADLERVEGRVGFTQVPHVRLELAAAAWRGDESTFPTIEFGLEVREKMRESAWRLGLTAVWQEAWTEILAAVLREGRRDRVRLFGGGVVGEGWYLQGYGEYRWLLAEEEGVIPDDKFGAQFAAGVLTEWRLWGGAGSAGRHFFDFDLRSDHRIETHLSLEAGVAHWAFHGDEDLLTTIPLLEESTPLWIGPSLGYAEDAWGVQGKLFAGADTTRDLAFGEVWIASAEAITTWNSWKIAVRAEYLREALPTSSDSAWGMTLGVHRNY